MEGSLVASSFYSITYPADNWKRSGDKKRLLSFIATRQVALTTNPAYLAKEGCFLRIIITANVLMRNMETKDSL